MVPGMAPAMQTTGAPGPHRQAICREVTALDPFSAIQPGSSTLPKSSDAVSQVLHSFALMRGLHHTGGQLWCMLIIEAILKGPA